MYRLVALRRSWGRSLQKSQCSCSILRLKELKNPLCKKWIELYMVSTWCGKHVFPARFTRGLALGSVQQARCSVNFYHFCSLQYGFSNVTQETHTSTTEGHVLVQSLGNILDTWLGVFSFLSRHPMVDAGSSPSSPMAMALYEKLTASIVSCLGFACFCLRGVAHQRWGRQRVINEKEVCSKWQDKTTWCCSIRFFFFFFWGPY